MDEGLCFGDINGDGMLDFVTYGPGPREEGRTVAVLRNDLPKHNWVRVQLIGKKEPGNSVPITVERNGQTLELKAELTGWPKEIAP